MSNSQVLYLVQYLYLHRVEFFTVTVLECSFSSYPKFVRLGEQLEVVTTFVRYTFKK